MKSGFSQKASFMNEIAIEKEYKFTSNKKVIRFVIFLSLLLWCLGFTYASLFPKSQMIILYPLLKQFYSSVCHQIGYKTIQLNGINFLVCARCSGIYFGGLITSILFLFFPKSYSLKVHHIFIAAVPMLLDVILYSTGVYEYSKIIALSSGLLFGFVAMSILLNIIENFLLKEKQNG
jgi:uncharacterized membrane protein